MPDQIDDARQFEPRQLARQCRTHPLDGGKLDEQRVEEFGPQDYVEQ
jgi:hypothetical protein